MAYKIKHKHQRVTQKYFLEHEIKPRMAFKEITKVGTRRTFHISESVHKKGQLVEYKDRIGKVKKVSRRGIYVELLSKPTDESLAGKPEMVFITQKEIEKGKVYPAYLTSMPPFFAYKK